MVNNGESDYVIIKGTACSPSETTATAELQSYITQISGKTLNTNQHIYIFQWQYEGLVFTGRERKQIDALWDAAEEHAGNEQQLADIQRSRLSFRTYKANLITEEFPPLTSTG